MKPTELAVALLVFTAVLSGLFTIFGCSALTTNTSTRAKAAIIDQLYTRHPNQVFIDQTTQYLEDYGFEVDVYRGDAVKVDLYRELPTYGYKLIIFRVHSGLLGVDPKVTNRTWLFTAEPYSELRHVTEQMSDELTYARISEHEPWIFAVSAKFITQSMKEQFNKTAIIMMGCDCFHFRDLAQAFIQKGASTYMAWDFSVGVNYVDDATTALIENLCLKELTLGTAVAKTMNEKGPDLKHGSVLKYYPPQTGAKTLRQLIK